MVDIEKILRDHDKRIKKLEAKEKANIGKKKGNPTSITDFIIEMKDERFFDKPKLLKEIINELSRRGHHYNVSSLTEPLQRAVRQKKLGRVGQKGKWQYVRR